MDGEQAWREAVNLLRMEIDVGTYNNWIKPAEFLSWDGNVFTIAAGSQLQQDWLASRLKSKLERLLTGILNANVQVAFVVQEETGEDASESEGNLPPASYGDDSIALRAEFKSIYDAIVQPDRVIAIPAYLFQLINQIGADLSWLYVAFRQAAYLSGATRQPGKSAAAPAKLLSRFSGMSLRTVRRRLQQDTTWTYLQGLVERNQTQKTWQKIAGGHPHQAPASYLIQMTMPLSSRDNGILRSLISSVGHDPISLLSQTAHVSFNSLRSEFNVENSNPPRSSQSIRQIIAEVFPELDQQHQVDWSEALSSRIMPPNDLIILSHYFVEHWLPVLGSGPGWMVTYLRDRAYFNPREGELRDEVTIEGGYAEIAGLLGIKRVKTIWEWLQRPEVGKFIKEIGRGEGPFESSARKFKICLVDPLLDTDIPETSLSATGPIGANDTHRKGDEDPPVGAFGTTVDGLENAGLESSSVGANDTHRNGAVGTSIGAIDTHRDGAFGTPVGAFGILDWRDWHSLISLNSLNTTRNTPNTPRPAGAKTGGGGEVVWDLEQLFQLNGISNVPKDSSHRGENGTRFVAWLIYAASPAGTGIENGVAVAAARLKNLDLSPGRVYERLASLPPPEFSQILARAIQLEPPNFLDWQLAFPRSELVRLRRLADQLGINLPGA